MNAVDVKPEKWIRDKNYPIRVLYDDGNYSIIWGNYEGNPALGTRWNKGADVGFPRQGAHPTWYVEPDFLAICILQRIQCLSIDNRINERLDDINFALKELSIKMAKG